MPTNNAFQRPINKLTLLFSSVLLAFILTGEFMHRSSANPEKEIKNPFAGDPQAIEYGKAAFRKDCGLCHGFDARGGGRGPDLTSERWTHGDSDAAIFQTISKGVPGTEMPASRFTENEVWMMVAYLRSLGAGSAAPIVGDREAGEKLFVGDGLCSHCHMVKGKGGRLGPDLTRIGASRSVNYLIESIRDPNKEIPPAYETVIAVTKNGARIAGVRKNEDTFSLQLLDQKEQLHMFLKKDLQEVIYDRKSLMPGYNERMLSEKQLQDLLAYLDSLRGK